MRINRILIKNFRCYYDENPVSFNKDGKITLIYGDSGFGKSSFLQFFKWAFYDEPNFGKKDDKPLFNICAFEESKLNDIIEVKGEIYFEHLGIEYQLIKTLDYKVGLSIQSTKVVERKSKLSILKADNWEPFTGDIANKINNILPRGLANYFLLDGESARDIVLDSKKLKLAIYSLFGLDAYEKAIKHLGSDRNSRSVIGYFNKLMTSQMKNVQSGMSAAEFQETLEELFEEIEDLKIERKDDMAKISDFNARRDEIFKILGAIDSKNNLNQIIKQNNAFISAHESKIKNTKNEIGNLFYNNYTHLFLSKITSKSSTILREKNLTFANTYKNVFETLKKNLLVEIKEKHMCVCNRPLDNQTVEHIDGLIGVMPPDSYTYQFGQFIAKAKRDISTAKTNINTYDEYINNIAKLEQKITSLQDDNHEKLETLKRLDEAKNLVEELESIKDELEKLNRHKGGLEGKIAQKKQVYDISDNQLKNLQKNDKVSNEYSDKIKFYKNAAELLEIEKDAMENKVKNSLNKCVREIFKKLSTQTEINADSIDFVNNDFSLRTTYLSGGQLAVDVYSYVIGIVKSLQECNMENTENPIIIDAPFAFTGNRQSEHIFKTLPTVSKQTILLTLDLNKIRKLLNDTSNYEFLIIKNQSQDKAKIETGNINDINF
ncbi:MAG: AAA family ATPase [bacterium]